MSNQSILPVYCGLDWDKAPRNTGNPQTQELTGTRNEDPLGREFTDVSSSYGSRAFKFTQVAAAANCTLTNGVIPAGSVMWYTDDMRTVVTNKLSASQQNSVAGVVPVECTAGRHPGYVGWVQTDGDHAAVYVDGSTFAAGNQIMASSSDGEATIVVSGDGHAATYPIIGTALGSSTGSSQKTVAANLHVGKFGG